ncbi:MAG: hypothetical protein K0S71_208 [Clostridia bacterium]|jgi:FlaA1/EpsC-like NDP-sugar epimerase|nr:hypothetical protein [Clostridia bacterium]
MKISQYLGYFLKDFFTALGCLLIMVMMVLGFYSIEVINTSLHWQITLAALAYTFFKFALVNKFELEGKTQMINLCVCLSLADMMIILWLWFFAPNKMVNTEVMIAYIIIAFIVHGIVYAMMYIDGHRQAKQLNERLNTYHHEENK